MDRRDDDIEGNAWPGFVDILSAVIIMFVFFVLIIAIILSILSIERVADKKLSADEGDPKAAQMQQVMDLLQSGEVTIEDMAEFVINKKRAEALTMEISELEKEIQQIQIGLSNSDFENNQIIESENELIIMFDRNAVIVGQEAIDRIKSFLSSKNKSQKINITTSDNPNASYVSSTRKINLARSFNVRNELINENWVTKNIKIDFQEPLKIQNSYDWVKIEVQQ